MTNSSGLIGYEIKTVSGSILKPTSVNLWNQKSRFSEFTPHEPLKFKADALIGLQLQKLIQFKHTSPELKQTLEDSIKSFCPYTTLYKNSSERVPKSNTPARLEFEKISHQFENDWFNFWDAQASDYNLSFNKVDQLIEIISDFESKIKNPLLYNFDIKFSTKLTEHLLTMYSFLFHLRSFIALNHNALIEDSAFQSIKCDSISDYLPRVDFTTNDALIYWQFKKLSTPFVNHKDKDIRIEKLFVEPMQRAFNQYNHNACALIDQLPQAFLSEHAYSELEHKLHQAQMDWLLGTSAGLLFRVREELYGLYHGYDKVFWLEASTFATQKALTLKVCVDMQDWIQEIKAA
ncbi:MAG: hypothetical protein ACK41T_05630 [Pseudobdellovibrio sp.]